jgi:quercetin dioxygenase-like cupin family protein
VIKYGHLDIDVRGAKLAQIKFQDLHECYRQYEQLDAYYNKQNSSIWQMFDDDCPNWVWQMASRLLESLNESPNYVVSIVRIDPGNTIPNHVDAHFKVQEKHGKGKTARYLIMLEDWKSGHYYEIHNQPYIKWRKGDWTKFEQGDWHLAGNMGDEPFYSMQVTVKYDEELT